MCRVDACRTCIHGRFSSNFGRIRANHIEFLEKQRIRTKFKSGLFRPQDLNEIHFTVWRDKQYKKHAYIFDLVLTGATSPKFRRRFFALLYEYPARSVDSTSSESPSKILGGLLCSGTADRAPPPQHAVAISCIVLTITFPESVLYLNISFLSLIEPCELEALDWRRGKWKKENAAAASPFVRAVLIELSRSGFICARSRLFACVFMCGGCVRVTIRSCVLRPLLVSRMHMRARCVRVIFAPPSFLSTVPELDPGPAVSLRRRTEAPALRAPHAAAGRWRRPPPQGLERRAR